MRAGRPGRPPWLRLLITFQSGRRICSSTYNLFVHAFVHTLNGMEIEFDPDKAAANPLNHEGVTFDEAKAVLLDPYALTREDPDAEGEQRFVSLGMGGKGRILLVVWTLRGDNPRQISAWKANQPQRRRNEQQF